MTRGEALGKLQVITDDFRARLMGPADQDDPDGYFFTRRGLKYLIPDLQDIHDALSDSEATEDGMRVSEKANVLGGLDILIAHLAMGVGKDPLSSGLSCGRMAELHETALSLRQQIGEHWPDSFSESETFPGTPRERDLFWEGVQWERKRWNKEMVEQGLERCVSFQELSDVETKTINRAQAALEYAQMVEKGLEAAERTIERLEATVRSSLAEVAGLRGRLDALQEVVNRQGRRLLAVRKALGEGIDEED